MGEVLGSDELRPDYSKPENQAAFDTIKKSFPDIADRLLSSAENEAWREHIFRDGKEHYPQYLLSRINHAEIVEEAYKYANYFDEVVFPKAIDREPEILERATRYAGGAEDSEIDDLLVRAKADLINSDIPSEYKALAVAQLLVKQRSYFEAVNEQVKIEYIGFDDDPDFKDLPTFLEGTFGQKLLNSALISEITYHPDIVIIAANPGRFNIPLDAYLEWKERMPQLGAVKSRAESFAVINSSFNIKKYVRLPIDIYSFIDEDTDSLEYFAGMLPDQRMRLYKLGAVIHEIGHSLYEYLTTKKMREEWRAIIETNGPVSNYGRDYTDGTRGTDLRLDEEFCEAIRLAVTAPQYLRGRFPEVLTFLNIYFPEIKSDIPDTIMQ